MKLILLCVLLLVVLMIITRKRGNKYGSNQFDLYNNQDNDWYDKMNTK